MPNKPFIVDFSFLETFQLNLSFPNWKMKLIVLSLCFRTCQTTEATWSWSSTPNALSLVDFLIYCWLLIYCYPLAISSRLYIDWRLLCIELMSRSASKRWRTHQRRTHSRRYYSFCSTLLQINVIFFNFTVISFPLFLLSCWSTLDFIGLLFSELWSLMSTLISYLMKKVKCFIDGLLW